jgi:hypothetical protein
VQMFVPSYRRLLSFMRCLTKRFVQTRHEVILVFIPAGAGTKSRKSWPSKCGRMNVKAHLLQCGYGGHDLCLPSPPAAMASKMAPIMARTAPTTDAPFPWVDEAETLEAPENLSLALVYGQRKILCLQCLDREKSTPFDERLG